MIWLRLFSALSGAIAFFIGILLEAAVFLNSYGAQPSALKISTILLAILFFIALGSAPTRFRTLIPNAAGITMMLGFFGLIFCWKIWVEKSAPGATPTSNFILDQQYLYLSHYLAASIAMVVVGLSVQLLIKYRKRQQLGPIQLNTRHKRIR